MNKRFYNFGEHRLDTHNQRLLCGGETIKLTLKEFELLFALVGNAGDVVSKDALLETVWKDVSVAEETLTRNISWLRKKLGSEAGGNEHFIETVPKRGYRFTATVTMSDAPEIIVEEQSRTRIRIEETLSLSEPPAVAGGLSVGIQPLFLSENPSATAGGSDKKWLALGIVALVAVGLTVYQIYFRRTATNTSVAARVVPFSGLSGRENYPAFSPDGKQLAFAWNGGEADNLDIYVRLLDAGEPLRLTDTEFTEQHPTFSPDGSHVAFVRTLKTGGEVIIIPALGGAERRVTRLFSGFASISFAPDGETLAIVDTEDSTTDKNYGVHLVNLKNGERRRLNQPGEYAGETTPRFAPDGKSLAFVRVAADNSQDLFVSPTTGGEPRQITFDRKTIHSLAWSADGTEIFFVSLRGSSQPNIWRVAATGGEPELIATGNNKDITNLAVSRDGKTIAFVENTLNLDIWRTEKNPSAKNQPEKKFIGSTYNEFSPDLSPDGSRLIFVSNRTGKTEIWMADAGGKNLRQITDSPSVITAPHFSPDGSQIVYYAMTNGNADIFSISTDGGTARRLTADASEKTAPIWSADGTSIYFVSNRTGENQIWKMSAAGGEPVQITRQGAFQILAALPDGDDILFVKTEDAAVWRVSANSGANEQIVPELAAANLFSGNWAATRRGLYFLAQNPNKSLKIKFYDFSGGNVADAAEKELPENYYGGITASADGNTFLYVRQDQNASSIMFAELGK